MNVSVKNPISRSPLRRGFLLITLALGCFALSSVAQAGPQLRPSPTPSPAPATQPFQAFASGYFPAGTTGVNVPITTVPAGKRLVIEHVSVLSYMLTGEKMILAEIGVALQNVNNGIQVTHPLTISAQGSSPLFGLDVYTASGQVRLYADPGTQVNGDAGRDNAGGSESVVTFVISGYLVDVP